MTMIVLAVLGSAWLLYLALWLREKKAYRPTTRSTRSSSGRSSPSFLDPPAPIVNALAPIVTAGVSSAALVDGAAVGSRSLGDLLEAPRTPRAAMRRRQHVAAAIIGVAALALLAVPVFGTSALAVHVLADLGVVAFAMGVANRQSPAGPALADVQVLYPNRPAAGEAAMMPLGRVANG